LELSAFRRSEPKWNSSIWQGEGARTGLKTWQRQPGALGVRPYRIFSSEFGVTWLKELPKVSDIFDASLVRTKCCVLFIFIGSMFLRKRRGEMSCALF